MQSGQLLRTIDAHAQPPVHALNLSSDGKLLATGGEDSLAKAWDIQSGKELHRFQAASRVTDVAFQPNASVLATTGDTETALWDLKSGQKLRNVEQPDGSWPIYLAFRPDGKKLATSGSRIRISDVSTGKPADQLPRSGGSVSPAIFTADGNSLIAGSADGTVRLWDLKTLTVSRVLSHIKYGPDEMALSRQGDLLATLENHPNVVTVWDIAKETKKHVFKGEGQYRGKLAMSPDGKWLALCDPHPIEMYRSTVRIWDQRSGVVKRAIQSSNNIAGLFFTPDGKSLIAAKQNTNASYLEVWEVESLEEEGKRQELGGLVNLHGSALSASGGILAVAGTFHGLAEKPKQVIVLWDLVERHPRFVLDLGESSAKYLAFAPDDRTLLSAPSAGNEICVWDPRDGKRRETIRLGEPAFDNIRWLAFAGDSRHFAVSISNGTACIVRIQTPPLDVLK